MRFFALNGELRDTGQMHCGISEFRLLFVDQGQMLIEFLPDCTEYRGTSKVYFANLVSVTQSLDITMA